MIELMLFKIKWEPIRIGSNNDTIFVLAKDIEKAVQFFKVNCPSVEILSVDIDGKKVKVPSDLKGTGIVILKVFEFTTETREIYLAAGNLEEAISLFNRGMSFKLIKHVQFVRDVYITF